jgi:putative copper resistance protein D
MAILLTRNRWLSRRRKSALEIGTALVATSLLASFSLTGHAAAAGPLFSGRVLVDASHLFITSLWPAGLVPFALFLSHSPRRQAPFPQAPFGKVVARFSNASLLAVVALSATGLLNACQLVGSLSALFTTTYGQVLGVKLALFGLILVLASANRLCFVPSLVADNRAADEEIPSSSFRSLRLFVTIEIGLAVAVVAVVSLLGITPPPDLHSPPNSP